MRQYIKNIFVKVFFFGIACLALLVLAVAWQLQAPRSFTQEQVFNIPEGSSLRSVSRSLQEKNIIRSTRAFEVIVVGYGGDKKILPGDYLLESKMNVFEVAHRISSGKRYLVPIKVTIPEGHNVNDVAEIFALKLSSFDKENFLSIAKGSEGYLFPDTYFFFRGDTEEDVFKLMMDNFAKKMATLEKEITSIQKTQKEIIIMASILEREAYGDDDRDIISGILWKRLSINMALQVDAAPITYQERGLPKDPIANPGMKAIKSAMYPESSPYLFYLHDKTGTTHYARNFEEHKRNIAKYLR